jgi:hypothetical protein
LASRAEECRAKAAECERRAKSSKDDVREGYLQLARQWLTLAEFLERQESPKTD